MADIIVEAENINYAYLTQTGPVPALNDITLNIRQGEFVVLLGHNGSGKSSLARHINCLIPIESGKLKVAYLDASLKENVMDIRRHCSMVFQNPDNQFVSSIVGEDVAFGPRNFGIAEEYIPGRIADALDAVGMSGFEARSPQLLSGGQKQRIAIAGVLASNPDIMIFDEVTSMLDPEGRRSVLDIINTLHEMGKTIIMISHYIEEAFLADRVIFIHDGQILGQGSPRETLTDLNLLAKTGILPSIPVKLYYDLLDAGIELPGCPASASELVDMLCR